MAMCAAQVNSSGSLTTKQKDMKQKSELLEEILWFMDNEWK